MEWVHVLHAETPGFDSSTAWSSYIAKNEPQTLGWNAQNVAQKSA